MLAWFHPIAPVPVLLGLGAWSVIVSRWPGAWLFAVPAVLPWLGFAPWTGWVAVEEFDLFVLASAGGGYWALARSPSSPYLTPACRSSPPRGILILLLSVAACAVVALGRGLAGWAEGAFGWFGSYSDPVNTLRSFKSLALAYLLAPLLWAAFRRSEMRALGRLSAGITVGLCTVVVAVVWERALFPGLLNFSGHYRTTALFWEMHVGGAAIDCFLALSVPFVFRFLWLARTPLRWLMGAVLVVGVAYACLTTFSRGVYLAVAASLAVLALLLSQRPGSRVPVGGWWMLRLTLLLGAAAVAAVMVFQVAAYAGALSVLGLLTAALQLAGIIERVPMRRRLAAAAGSAALGIVAALAARMAAGDGLVHFTFAALIFAVLLLALRRRPSARQAVACLVAFAWAVFATAGIFHHRAGIDGLLVMAVVLALMLGFTLGVAAGADGAPSSMRAGWRVRGSVMLTAALLLETAIILSGGSSFMMKRVVSSERDFGGRLEHWQKALSALNGPTEWLLGRGLGRFPAVYSSMLPENEFPGGFRLRSDGSNQFMEVWGPPTRPELAGLFGVSQRVRLAAGERFSLAFDVRSRHDVWLLLSLCEKHLLYEAACWRRAHYVRAEDAVWQALAVSPGRIDEEPDAPAMLRPRVLSIAVLGAAKSAQIDRVSLVTEAGRELIVNGDFSRGGARWFLSGKHHFLPWHIDNLYLELLFDQGLIGLLALAALIALAAWRAVFQRVGGPTIAPFIAAALAGIATVGMVSSLMDMPRVAFLFYLLCISTLLLERRA